MHNYIRVPGLGFAGANTISLGDSIMFAEPTLIFEVPCARSVAVADFNKDGRGDIALAVWGPQDSDDKTLKVF